MKTKEFFVKVGYAILDFLDAILVLLACNPLSMFVCNVFDPEGAAQFVRDFIGFNDFWLKFYTKHALKWPIGWSKYWIELDNLKQCSVHKQVAYYLTNPNRSQIIKEMSSGAQVELVHEHSELIEQITEQMRLTDDMFAEWLELVIQYDSYRSEDIEKTRSSHPFSKYLKTGKLPFSQVMLLTKAAVEERNIHAYEGLMNDLGDYIERFGLSKKQLEQIAQYMSDNLYWRDTFAETPVTDVAKMLAERNKFHHFYSFLEIRQAHYEQRIFTRSQKGSKQTDKWLKFCEKECYICPAAQKEMGLDQYHVFHATGHSLCEEAVMYFLQYPDRSWHSLVFRYEPLSMFEKKEIQNLIFNNGSLKAVFDYEKSQRMHDEDGCLTAEKSETGGHVGGKLLI